MADELAKIMRLARDVAYQARLEERRLRNAIAMFVFFSVLVACLLGVDYMAARIMFTYLDPTLGDVSLGPEFLALTVPVAVVAIHLLIAEDGGHTLEYRLRRLAGIGVIVFLFGMASMVSLVYFDASDGVGSQGSDIAIDGMIGDDDLGGGSAAETSFVFSAFRALFSSIAPIVFFVGMTLILFVTAYACHRLMVKIAAHHDFFAGASRRSRVLKRGLNELETLGIDIRKQEARLARERKKLPADPEYQFSQSASAAINKALHAMKLALRGLGEVDALRLGVFERKADIPAHIETRDDGMAVIAEIRDATRPYAILKNLGGYPPREEED